MAPKTILTRLTTTCHWLEQYWQYRGIPWGSTVREKSDLNIDRGKKKGVSYNKFISAKVKK